MLEIRVDIGIVTHLKKLFQRLFPQFLWSYKFPSMTFNKLGRSTVGSGKGI